MSIAIQFIQQHGVDKARKLAFDPLHPQMTHVTDDGRHWLNKNHPHCHATENELKDMIVLADLKRLVESVDLIINEFESVEMAEYEYMICASHSEPYWIRTKQAIADYETIYPQ